MLALVIDTSSAAVTAGVVDCAGPTPRLCGERVVVDARAHGEQLAPSIRAALAQASIGIAQLSAVVAGVGPGPFTGLRVGLVTAAAISDALGIPAYDVCSLDAIAAAVRQGGQGHQEQKGPLLVATDARRREVYWARYLDGVRVGSPAVAKPADLLVELAGSDGVGYPVAMAGAGSRQYAQVLALPLIGPDFPTVLGLAGLAMQRVRQGAPGEPLTPLYLRRPDAVEPAARKAVSQL
ncbi:tRNA (adenosine(37)-N6)-threonylcarbamoyltransferase complex dimerization subunit type 1 TsaB [Jatrophihabitans sp. DSM 45814]